jgi:hypothetical protein
VFWKSQVLVARHSICLNDCRGLSFSGKSDNNDMQIAVPRSKLVLHMRTHKFKNAIRLLKITHAFKDAS